ncbi:hypothetical protein [Olleya aquimaris]|uniref:Uncharacterized protein n=1 Tax=Olleya aquimaris TaxID=639310 RepID=A0A327RTC6_9FLAO|nr:hypothetical protein [Olleya aquimaris]RAJ16917.1 hypothetical protein LY08_00693 [Olleya aquimaris]
MKESTQNIIYKWTLRANYIYIFLAGAGLVSFGLDTLIEPGKLTDREELNYLMGFGSILFGFIIIIIGFYRKNEVEKYILQQKL